MAESVIGSFEKVALAVRELDLLAQDADGEELAALVGIVQRCCNTLEHVRRTIVDRACASEVWEAEGCRTPARWLSLHTAMSAAAAAVVCRQARDLRELPLTRAAALEGALHASQVEAIARCHRLAPPGCAVELEALLLELAAQPEDFRAAVKAFRAAVAVTSRGPDPVVHASLSMREADDGWQIGSMRLGPEDGAVVAAALDRRVSRMIQLRREGDASLEALTIGAMRAQALVDICDADLRRDPGARRSPDRHRLALTMQLDGDGNVVPVGRLPAASTCDVELFRMVVGAKGEVLDVGRAERTWSPAQVTAVIRRDRHCCFPGCSSPPGYCDIHHLVPWERGGRTDIANAALLCRWHHTFLHRQHWRMQLSDDHRPVVIQPDGSPYVPRSHAPACRRLGEAHR